MSQGSRAVFLDLRWARKTLLQGKVSNTHFWISRHHKDSLQLDKLQLFYLRKAAGPQVQYAQAGQA